MTKFFVMLFALVLMFSCSVTSFAKNDNTNKFIVIENNEIKAYIQTVTINDISQNEYAKEDKTASNAIESINRMVILL